MSVNSDTTTVTATKNYVPPDNNLYVVIGKAIFSDFSNFTFQRDIENVPSSFTMEVPLTGDDFPKDIQNNNELMIYKNKKQIFHGYMEQFNISMSGNNQHSLVIAGRSKLRDIIDGMPEIAGTSIQNVNGIDDIGKLLCHKYNVGYINKSKSKDKTAWGSVPFNLGDTAFGVISRYARYEGKLLYDDGYGALIVNDASTDIMYTFNHESPIMSATFSSDLTMRYKEYHVYWQPYTTQSQTGLPPVMKAYDPEQSLWKCERTKVMINSTSDENGSIAQRLATWEANRSYGRSKSVTITIPNWKDPEQTFYDVNQMCVVDLPSINVHNAQMIICSISYEYSNESGSLCHLTLYPKEALSFEPIVLFSANPALQAAPQGE